MPTKRLIDPRRMRIERRLRLAGGLSGAADFGLSG